MNGKALKYIDEIPEIKATVEGREVCWLNKSLRLFSDINGTLALTMQDIDDAEARLSRFAPYIAKQFPETASENGLIESPLREISKMRSTLNAVHKANLQGKLFLKMDSNLAIAGSIKARGGIYEILKYAEGLAIENGLLKETDNYAILAEQRFVDFFGKHTIQVGSTGNLGMSIGIISAKLGFKVIVHMSGDAKQWKKDLLRSRGVQVQEYDTDYGEAVNQGRANSDKDPQSYFVDDENSVSLFLGYSVAAKRLKKQLAEQNIAVDTQHPLFLYLPCGIGGAPGGIAFGIKSVFGDAAHCFFDEPINACCMLMGISTGLHDEVCVQDFDISGKTHADGLAVGRPSAFVGKFIEPMLSGIFTIKDAKLYDYMRELIKAENIFIEPSACSAFAFAEHPQALLEYSNAQNITDVMQNATHIAWATGGSLVPPNMVEEYKNTYI